MDGVTMNVPLALLNQLDEAAIDWLVPGMVRDKIAWTMKALPKRIRSALVPVPEHVTAFLERVKPGERPIAEEVLAYASRLVGERLDSGVWSKDEPPAHLLMNLRVVDDAKRELAMGRDLGALRKQLGEAAQLTLSQSKPGLEREGIKAWDFGDLPAEVTFRRGNQTLTGYPALVDEGESVAIRLMDTKDKALEAHRGGVKRLLAFDLKEQVKQLERGPSGFNALALKLQAVMPADRLRADFVAAVTDRAFIGEDEPPRSPKGYEEQKKRAKTRLPAVTEAVTRHANAIADANHALTAALAQSSALGKLAHEVKAQQQRLVFAGFLSRTPWERFEHLPRYLKGLALRMQKFRANPERDHRHGPVVAGLWNQYEARAAADQEAERRDPKLEEFRWLIEELRISLFAQELKTPFPVSAKRLSKFWDEHLRR
jgi:ATP-dependent helicase HrpA